MNETRIVNINIYTLYICTILLSMCEMSKLYPCCHIFYKLQIMSWRLKTNYWHALSMHITTCYYNYNKYTSLCRKTQMSFKFTIIRIVCTLSFLFALIKNVTKNNKISKMLWPRSIKRSKPLTNINTHIRLDIKVKVTTVVLNKC